MTTMLNYASHRQKRSDACAIVVRPVNVRFGPNS